MKVRVKASERQAAASQACATWFERQPFLLPSGICKTRVGFLRRLYLTHGITRPRAIGNYFRTLHIGV